MTSHTSPALPTVSPNAVYWVAVMVVTIPPALISTIWFHKRRNRQPIKARQPRLIVIISAVLVIWFASLCFRGIYQHPFPCWLQLWMAYLGLIVLASMYLIRCFILYGNFNLTSEMLDADEKRIAQERLEKLIRSQNDVLAIKEREYEEIPDLWWTRNKKWLQESVLLKLTVLPNVVLLIPVIVSTVYAKDHHGNGCMKKWKGAAVAMAAYAVGYGLIFILFSVLLRGRYDAFGIKRELFFTGLLAILSAIPWFALNTIDAFWGDLNDRYSASTICLLFMIAVAFTLAVINPLYRSIVSKPLLKLAPPDAINTLEQLLRSKEGYKSFKKYLETEFAVENLLFWQAVKDFEQLVSKLKPRQLRRYVTRYHDGIYNMYVKEGADYQINISQADLKRLEDLNRKIHSGEYFDFADKEDRASKMSYILRTYKTVQQSIFHLMKRNRYARFKRSISFKLLSTKFQEDNQMRAYLRQMDIVDSTEFRPPSPVTPQPVGFDHRLDYIVNVSINLDYWRFMNQELQNSNILERNLSKWTNENIRIMSCAEISLTSIQLMTFTLLARKVSSTNRMGRKLLLFRVRDIANDKAAISNVKFREFEAPEITKVKAMDCAIYVEFKTELLFAGDICYVIQVTERDHELQKRKTMKTPKKPLIRFSFSAPPGMSISQSPRTEKERKREETKTIEVETKRSPMRITGLVNGVAYMLAMYTEINNIKTTLYKYSQPVTPQGSSAGTPRKPGLMAMAPNPNGAIEIHVDEEEKKHRHEADAFVSATPANILTDSSKSLSISSRSPVSGQILEAGARGSVELVQVNENNGTPHSMDSTRRSYSPVLTEEGSSPVITEEGSSPVITEEDSPAICEEDEQKDID